MYIVSIDFDHYLFFASTAACFDANQRGRQIVNFEIHYNAASCSIGDCRLCTVAPKLTPNLTLTQTPTKIQILKGYSSQVFHFWPKCLNKPKAHSGQIWSFYVLQFQDIAVQN